MREEAGDDRQLNWSGRSPVGNQGFIYPLNKKDMPSSKYAMYVRYNEGFPKADKHLNEGGLKSQCTEQGC